MFSKKPKTAVTDQSVSFKSWLKAQVEAEKYWFHRMELAPDLVTPGWSDPKTEKLPFFGLPEDMRGMRVLDIGCAEGFFSFEAERRGAKEVIGIDSFPDSVRRFNICRNAYQSKATAFLCNVYDLNVRAFGTFDMVFFFGVLYHLRNPILALEKIFGVCTGTLLTLSIEVPSRQRRSELITLFHLTQNAGRSLVEVLVAAGAEPRVGPEDNPNCTRKLESGHGIRSTDGQVIDAVTVEVTGGEGCV
jgi:2-polyprenyl-3-methyl-5-hydroxy-6-metoxy-1,4-benzoquinol methylase